MTPEELPMSMLQPTTLYDGPEHCETVVMRPVDETEDQW